MGIITKGSFVLPFKLLRKKLGEFKRVHNALFPVSPDLLYNTSRHGRKEESLWVSVSQKELSCRRCQ